MLLCGAGPCGWAGRGLGVGWRSLGSESRWCDLRIQGMGAGSSPFVQSDVPQQLPMLYCGQFEVGGLLGDVGGQSLGEAEIDDAPGWGDELEDAGGFRGGGD